MKRCITISILDFNQIPGEKSHSVFTLRDAAGREWTDLFEIHIIELKKQLTGDSPVNDWIRLFNATCEEDLDMIQSKSKGMSEAVGAVKSMGLVRNLRWMFEQRQKAIRDRWAEDDFIREESESKGRAEGLVTAVDNAMRNTGWDLQTACRNLGITVEEYQEVKLVKTKGSEES